MGGILFLPQSRCDFMGSGRSSTPLPPTPLHPARLLDQRHSYVLEPWVGGETPGPQAPGSSHCSVIGRPGQLHRPPQALQPQLTLELPRGAADQAPMVLRNVATYSRLSGGVGCGEDKASLLWKK